MLNEFVRNGAASGGAVRPKAMGRPAATMRLNMAAALLKIISPTE